MEFQNVVYFLLWAALFFVMMRFGCGAHVMGLGHGRDHRAGTDAQERWAPPAKVTDPVCGMSVDTATAKTAIRGGHAYYFCSQECREKFEANPASYANTSSHPQEEHHGCC
jgi:YHS domain-containing protein